MNPKDGKEEKVFDVLEWPMTMTSRLPNRVGWFRWFHLAKMCPFQAGSISKRNHDRRFNTFVTT